jgi:hypothetical protein
MIVTKIVIVVIQSLQLSLQEKSQKVEFHRKSLIISEGISSQIVNLRGHNSLSLLNNSTITNKLPNNERVYDLFLARGCSHR